MGLTEENIRNHFLTNPEWKRVFTEHYPDWSPDTYVRDAKALFEVNGYRFEEDRMSKRPDSKFRCVVTIDLYHGDDFVFGLQGHELSVLEQLLIIVICEYEVDISKFK